MTDASARAFLPDIRALERELPIPIPRRVRILRELEYDLEELSARFVAEGLPPDEARARALEALVPDRGTLLELARLHRPLYRRLTRSVTETRLKALERAALVLVTAGTLLGQTLALTQTELLRDPSPFLWPVLGLGAILLTAVLATAFSLWIKGEHGLGTRGVRLTLCLSGAVLATGMVGVFVDTFRLASFLEHTPELAASLASAWLVRSCALLSVSLLLTLAGGLGWFVLHQWVQAVEGAHRSALGFRQ
jgi:hypothetical protein